MDIDIQQNLSYVEKVESSCSNVMRPTHVKFTKTTRKPQCYVELQIKNTEKKRTKQAI